MLKRASPNLQIILLVNMRTIGVNCPKILGEHRKLFEELREQTALRDYSQAALDVIEGRRYSVASFRESFCLSDMLCCSMFIVSYELLLFLVNFRNMYQHLMLDVIYIAHRELFKYRVQHKTINI